MKRFKNLVAVTAVCGISYTIMVGNTNLENIKDLTLHNIEALSNSEEDESFDCMKDGCVLCPNGTRVKYYLTRSILKELR